MKNIFIVLCVSLLLLSCIGGVEPGKYDSDSIIDTVDTSTTIAELPFECPVTNQTVPEKLLVHKGFVVSYNTEWRIPNWVAYELTSEEALGHYPRSNDFQPDPLLRGRGATNDDYNSSPYSRGHMAPAGDMKWDSQAMSESFYLSNVCPQNYKLNTGLWENLEHALRQRVAGLGSIYIVTGPVVEKGYTTIGRNKVCVPQAFFKVVCWQKNGQWHCKAFIVPNQNPTGRFHDYSVTVDEVEQRTGHDFFAALPDEVENVIEAHDTEGKW